MNWLSNFARPGLNKKKPAEKPETPDNLWIKCPLTGDLIFRADLEAAHWVTPAGFHMRIGPEARFRTMFDGQKWQKAPLASVPLDPLKFRDQKRYVDRIKDARSKNSRDDCAAAAYGRIGGAPSIVYVQDFEFMGGSLGMAAGEGFVAAAHAAIRRKAALVAVTASGGARMQEGILSLMQMPRTTLAIQELREAGLPYIVVLTDPTYGGVTASYAMLGDIHIAEPGALIGFTGPRIIEQTIRQKLPDGFQKAEYLLDKGMVDMVVDRRVMKEKLASLLAVLMPAQAAHEESGEADAAANVEPIARAARKPAGAKPKAKAAE
jgi:acetyl-CoA carboxylase carboxyl transferase subunit beta